MTAGEPTGSAAVRWPARVGAWLGIGTSPAALVLGAGLADRHGGPIALLGVLAGAVLMALMLFGQGLLGLAPPAGEGGNLAEVADGYVRRRTMSGLHSILAVAMIGWFGFNVGLGGAALAALAEWPSWSGVLALGGPVIVMAAAGISRWNALAVVTTAATLVLVTVIVARVAPPVSPLAYRGADVPVMLVDAGAFVGYVAVFALRAPDFSGGLASRRDLAWCVGLLVVSTVLVALAGVGLYLGTGTADPVSAIAGEDGSSVGYLLVAVAVVAATFTTLHSGSLALQAVSPLGRGGALTAIGLPGLVLAALRFDRLLLPWLSILAAVLPPMLVPMVFEAARRRRGKDPRQVPVVAWLPAALVALAVTVAGVPGAALTGLAVACIITLVVHRAR